MTVSIRKAYEDLISPKYDKNNILIYSALMFILGGFAILLSSQPKMSILFFPLFLIFWIIQTGYCALTAHNEIFDKKQVFPSLNDFQNIVITGIKTFFGNILLSLICFLVPSIIALFGCYKFARFLYAFFYGSNSASEYFLTGIFLLALSLVSAVITAYLFYLPILITYYRTLKFKDFFNFNNAAEFRKARKKYYHSYIWKALLIGILLYIISIPVTILFIIIANICFNTLSAAQTQILISNSFSIILSILAIFFMPNLIAQTVGRLTKNIPQEKDNT